MRINYQYFKVITRFSLPMVYMEAKSRPKSWNYYKWTSRTSSGQNEGSTASEYQKCEWLSSSKLYNTPGSFSVERIATV